MEIETFRNGFHDCVCCALAGNRSFDNHHGLIPGDFIKADFHSTADDTLLGIGDINPHIPRNAGALRFGIQRIDKNLKLVLRSVAQRLGHIDFIAFTSDVFYRELNSVKLNRKIPADRRKAQRDIITLRFLPDEERSPEHGIRFRRTDKRCDRAPIKRQSHIEIASVFRRRTEPPEIDKGNSSLDFRRSSEGNVDAPLRDFLLAVVLDPHNAAQVPRHPPVGPGRITEGLIEKRLIGDHVVHRPRLAVGTFGEESGILVIAKVFVDVRVAPRIGINLIYIRPYPSGLSDARESKLFETFLRGRICPDMITVTAQRYR